MQTRIEFDSTMARGSDEFSIPVFIIVGKVSERTAADRIGDFLSGGENDVKAAIELDPTLDGVAQTVRVTEAEVVEVSWSSTNYLAALFTVEVVA